MIIRLAKMTILVALLWGQAAAVAFDFDKVELRDLERCPYHKLASYADQTSHLKDSFLNHFDFPKDNLRFKRRWHRRRSYNGYMFIHLENVIVKSLNETILQDKQATAALLNAYKRLLYEELVTHPVLMKHLVPVKEGGLYSDFKMIRAVVKVKDAEELERVTHEMQEAYAAVAKRFLHEVKGYPKIYELLKDRADLGADPGMWNLGGAGPSPAIAGHLARRARKRGLIRTDGDGARYIPVQVYKQRSASVVVADIAAIEEARNWFSEGEAQKRLAPFLNAKDGLLNTRILEIFKTAKADPKIRTDLQFVERVRADAALLGANITAFDVQKIKEYLSRIDEFMPSLYITEAEPIHLADLQGAKHGVISFDLEDAGIQNVRNVMKGLRSAAASKDSGQSHHTIATNLLEALEDGQDKASRRFMKRRNSVETLLRKLGLMDANARISASGDDVTFLPGREIGDDEMKRLLDELRVMRGHGTKTRVTQQPQGYSLQNKEIDPGNRFELVSRLELIQKSILKWGLRRKFPELWRSGVLDNTQIGIIAHPVNERRTEITISLHFPKGKVIPELRSRLEQHVRELLKGENHGLFLRGVVFDESTQGSSIVIAR